MNSCFHCKRHGVDPEVMPCCGNLVCWDFCLYEEPKNCPCCKKKIKVVQKDPITKEAYVIVK